VKDYKKIISKIETSIEEYRKDITMTNYLEIGDECVIFLNLQNEKIYKEYSEKALLCNEIYDFIDDTYQYVKKNMRLRLEITFPSVISEKEKDRIIQIIRVHYAVNYDRVRKDIRKTNSLSLLMLGMGIVLLTVFGVLEYYGFNFVLRELIDVFARVFVREACDQFVFTNTRNRVEALKNLRLFKCDITKFEVNKESPINS
jgi:hypothetical protein